MAGSSQNSENNELDAYQDALQWYERLEEVLQQPRFMAAAVKTLIDACTEKIYNLVRLEEANLPSDDFNPDICCALLCLQEQLVRLKDCSNQVSEFSVASELAATQVNQLALQVNKSSEDEQLRNAIKSTQVIPQVSGLQDIGGLVNVKKTLETVIVLPVHQPQLYAGRNICNSILLYGPPGTGKTELVHALAAEVSACLFAVSASDILSHYVGQTEKLVRALFQTIKEQRACTTILFMDEIDGLCRRRNDTEAEWNRRLKTELMSQLSTFKDQPNVFFISATNCPWDLDEAFLRRFQQRIYVPLPCRPDRFDLLKIFTKGTPLETTSASWGDLLHVTEGYSGSDLATLVRNAQNIPITELIDNKWWELVGGFYQPAQRGASCENLINCDLRDLPEGSVQVRPAKVSDLITSVHVVGRTISETHINRYAVFASNNYITQV